MTKVAAKVKTTAKATASKKPITKEFDSINKNTCKECSSSYSNKFALANHIKKRHKISVKATVREVITKKPIFKPCKPKTIDVKEKKKERKRIRNIANELN